MAITLFKYPPNILLDMNLRNDLNHLKQKLMNEMILEYSCGDSEKMDEINMLINEIDHIIYKLDRILR